MGKNSVACCPACGKEAQYLVDWECSGLNDSIFNYTADFFGCPHCGLVYIENTSDEELSLFYNNECSYFEKAHFDITAPENIKKFEAYREVLANAGLSGTSISDIGCGRGGFLIWLKNNNWNANCTGVDIDLRSIPNVQENASEEGGSVAFQVGMAFNLPFANGTQSILSYFHVLEHIRNIDKVLSEAFRVLEESGHILIEVPDAERYEEYPVGTAFWFSIREHVNHFSAQAICYVLQRNGFSVTSVNRKLLPTPEFTYPSLMILAKKGTVEAKSAVNKVGDIPSFVTQSKEALKDQAENILEFHLQYSKLTFWGCSSELFSLLPRLNLPDFTLCDASKVKQQCTYRGIPIEDPATVPIDGALIIAPYLYCDAIEKAALERGWPKEAIFRLR